ncbi:hypothetical protein R9C00_27495 [Flammeovirgaceae bacterium SG7u.111]|nr:hypothetical protein [Flammeovirgaceae bacterium SG7u.132]WPO35445.1 hypothetical protein R9C00_27495 [Flammeovirgaceae bacterium SG7u.111]
MEDYLDFSEPAEEFNKLKNKIRLLISEQLFDEALELIAAIPSKCFSFDLSATNNLPVEDIMVFLHNHRQLNHFELLMMGDLFMLEGEVYYKLKQFSQSKNLYEKSQKVFTFLSTLKGKTFPIKFEEKLIKIQVMLRTINIEIKQ